MPSPSLALSCVQYLREFDDVVDLVTHDNVPVPAIYHTRFAGFTVEGSGGTALLVSQGSKVEISFDPFDRAILMIEAWSDPSRDNTTGGISSYDQDERAIEALKLVKDKLIFTGPTTETVWEGDRLWPTTGGIRVLDCCMMREPYAVDLSGDQQQGDGLVRWRMSMEVCYG